METIWTPKKQKVSNLKLCIVWNKSHFVMGRQDYQWKHESILYGWRDGSLHAFYGGRNLTTVWDMGETNR